MSPFGPWPGARSGAGDSLSLLELSFGHGVGADQTLPTNATEENQSFWLSPTLISDGAVFGQVREWPVTDDINHVGLIVEVGDCQVGEGESVILEVTKNGEGTGILVTIDDDDTGRFAADDDLVVTTDDNIGLRAVIAPGVGGSMRLQAKLVGTIGEAPPVVDQPFIDDRLTLWLESVENPGFPWVLDGLDIDLSPNMAPLTGSANDAGPYPHPGAFTAGLKATIGLNKVNGLNAIEMGANKYLCNDNAQILDGTNDFDQPRHSFHVVVPRGGANNGGPLGSYELASTSHDFWQAPHLEYQSGTLYVWSAKGFFIGTVDVTGTPATDWLDQLVIVEDIVKEDGTCEVRINGAVMTLAPGAPGDLGLPNAYLGYGIGCFLDLTLFNSAANMDFMARLTYKGPTELSVGQRQQTYDYLLNKFGPLGAV